MRDPARTACSAPNARVRGRAILSLSLLLSGAGGTPGITEAPILSVQLDADGDGRADTVDVFRQGLVVVRRSAGAASELRYAQEAGPLRSATVEIQTAGPEKRERYLAVRAVTAAGAARLLVATGTAGLRSVYEGPVGPVGRDGEYAISVSATASGLLRSQSAPGVQRCDGEGRLFPSRWRWPDGPWQPAPEVTLPEAADLAKLPRLTATAPGPADSGVPLGVYRFVAASAQGTVQRADLLAPPRELEDGSPVSAWQPSAIPQGAFVTARADGRDHAVRAVRLTPAKDARLGGLPRQLLLVLTGDGRGEGQRFVAELPVRPGREPLVVALPQPVPASCISLVIASPGSAGEPVAIGEAAIFSELDGGDQAAPRLVQRIVEGDQVASEGALRTLLLVLSRPGGQLGAARQALGEALPKARGAARRRLYQILQSLAEARPTSAEDSAALAGLLQQAILGAEDADRPVLWASLVTLGEKGAAEIQRMALDPARAPAVRSEALERLGTLTPPAVLQALLGARELSPQTGAQLLQRGFVRGVSAALRCRPATEERWELARRALTAAWPGADGAGADPGRAALLIEGMTQALSGCEATEARAQLGELLGTLWQRLDARPAERPAERESDGLFMLRLRLLQGLARLAAPGAVPFLRRVLESGAEPELRQTAVRVAGLQGAPLASPPPPELAALLGKGLGDSDAGVRLAAAVALAERPVVGLGPAIEKVLAGDAWPLVRRAAVEARAALCPASSTSPASVEALRRATADPDEPVQRQALLGVVRCEGAAALSVLNTLLTGADTPPGTRGHACALGARLLSGPAGGGAARAETPRALASALGELLGDPMADDRHAGALLVCARAVGEVGGSGEVGALLAALSEGTPAPMRRSVLGAITRLCGRTHLVGLSARDRKDLTKTLATQAADAATKEAAAAAQAACR